MLRQNTPNPNMMEPRRSKEELPIGSELLIALTLGLIGWWAIVHAVMWLAC